MNAAALLLLLAWPAAAQTRPDAAKLSYEDKLRASLILCMKVGASPEGRRDCARVLSAAKALSRKKQPAAPEPAAGQVEDFLASLDASSGTKTAAQLEAEFEAIAKSLPVRQFKPQYARHFPPPAPPAGAPGAAKDKEAPRSPLTAEGGKALTDKAAALGQALLPAKKDEKLPAAAAPGSEPWRADAREMHKIWACRHPRTADLSLCEFAARELRAHGIPWRLALANWDFATDLLPSHRYSAGGMTAEGLTDASWQWCKDHRDVVQGLLGRPGRRSDLYNPRASILWWIAEFEEQRAKMGEKTDPWRVAAGVFLPAAPYGKRAEKEIQAWRSTMAKQDRCVLSQKTKP